MTSRITAYKTTDTFTTSSQIELILKVYDGTIRQFESAVAAYDQQNISGAIDHIEKARQGLTHLYTTLDFEKGGDIARNLGELYVFMINQTNLAAATGDKSFIEKNTELMRNLREGWSRIRETDTAAPAAPVNPNTKFNTTA